MSKSKIEKKQTVFIFSVVSVDFLIEYHIEIVVPIQITFTIQVSEAQMLRLGEASVL